MGENWAEISAFLGELSCRDSAITRGERFSLAGWQGPVPCEQEDLFLLLALLERGSPSYWGDWGVL